MTLKILRKNKFPGVFIPSEVLEMNELTVKEQFVLSLINSLSYENELFIGCTASNKELGKISRLNEKYVSEIIAHLKNLKLVEQIDFDGRLRILRTNIKCQSNAEWDTHPIQKRKKNEK